MKPENNFSELTTDQKRILLRLIARGEVQISDLANPELIKILEGTKVVNLIWNECFDKDEYKHKGEVISKEEFDKLRSWYERVNPNFPSFIHVKHISSKDMPPLADNESEISE